MKICLLGPVQKGTPKVCLTLGTLLAGSERNEEALFPLQKAVDLISEKIGHIIKISSIYKTKSWGFDSDDFFNICIEVSTNLNPEKLIETVLLIENILGRNRFETTDYQDRVIDIDVLLFDDEIIFYNNLKVPHPKMLERKFIN